MTVVLMTAVTLRKGPLMTMTTVMRVKRHRDRGDLAPTLLGVAAAVHAVVLDAVVVLADEVVRLAGKTAPKLICPSGTTNHCELGLRTRRTRQFAAITIGRRVPQRSAMPAWSK
jgi:hypothetical protein